MSIERYFDNDVSKRIYEERVKYSNTDDYSHIIEVMKTTPVYISLDKKLNGKKALLFGTGVWGYTVLRNHPSVRWIGALDNSRLKNEFYGLKVFNPDELEKIDEYDDNTMIVISSRIYHEDIFNQLIRMRINKDQIVDYGKAATESFKGIYFDYVSADELKCPTFVDGGVFDGETSIDFLNWWQVKIHLGV